MTRPLLMIPGPIEISAAVQQAFAVPPPSHVSPGCIEAFGRSLERMRSVWRATPSSQPFIVAGSGTVAMDMAVANTIDAGDRVLIVNTGYFSDRIAEMASRRGAEVLHVRGEVGSVPEMSLVDTVASEFGPTVVVATHVDTSTGVRVDAKAIAALANRLGALSLVDGVCATAGEQFEMAEWGVDAYLTASQKAIGLPPGLALFVLSERALARRATLQQPPPLILDVEAWLPIMRAYEARKPSYFATPATNLVMALDASLEELDREGMPAVFARHQRAALAMRAAWKQLGLTLLGPDDVAANTLSAIRYPGGVDASLLPTIAQNGVVVAGGLHPTCKNEYFRVGHMGVVTSQPDRLRQTVQAVEAALNTHGFKCEGGAAAFDQAFGG